MSSTDRNVAERLLTEELQSRGWPLARPMGVVASAPDEGVYEVYVRLGTTPERYAAGRVVNGTLHSWRMVDRPPVEITEV